MENQEKHQRLNKSDTHPTISTGNMKEEKEGMDKLNSSINDENKRIDKDLDNIFSKVAKEGKSNRVLVGSEQKQELQTQTLKIQNFRRYFLFDKSNFNPKKPNSTNPNQPLISYGDDETFLYPKFSWDYESKLINHDKELYYSGFLACSIRIHKTKIEIRNLIPSMCLDEGKIVVRGWTHEEIQSRIRKIRRELEQHCIRALNAFIAIHGGKTDFNPSVTPKEYEGEINVIGGTFLESIKRDRFYINEVGKKVYNEPKFEHEKFSTAINHMSNIALSDFTPEIAGELQNINSRIETFEQKMDRIADANVKTAENVNYLAVNLNTHIPYLQKLSIATESNTESSKVLSHQVSRIADVLDKIEHIKKVHKSGKQATLKVKKYGLTDEEEEIMKNMDV